MTSITFNLRKGVKFHDGSNFNAEVAKWNLDKMVDAKQESNWTSVDIIDNYTVRVNFNQWAVTLPGSFAEGDTMAFVVSKAAFDKKGIDWMRYNMVGTGPFKQVLYTREVGTNLVRNSDYWVKGKPYLDEMNIVYVADYTTQKMLMETGALDMENIQPQDAAHFQKLGWNVEFIMEDMQVLILDSANPDSLYTNQKVREAVEYAIDKESIAKAFGYGYRVAPYQIPPRASAAHDPNFTGGRKYDPEKAKQLLAEAGYPDGFDTTIIQAAGPITEITIAVQASLTKIIIGAFIFFYQLSCPVEYSSVDIVT